MEITSPTLLIDEQKCRANIEKMALRAQENKVLFRPHFKTHQSATIGNWYRDHGVTAITVSSVKMAKYFAKAGWNDITIAFPLNIHEIPDLKELNEFVNLNLTITSAIHLEKLIRHFTQPIGIFIEINTGYNRSGIWHEDNNKIIELVQSVEKENYMDFKGLLIHSGNTYEAASKKEIENIYQEDTGKLLKIKEEIKDITNQCIISVGDTPSCSLVENLKPADEIRPGNFIFFDITQLNIGSCKPEDIATVMACPVVDKNPREKEIIIHGGAIHFSKDVLYDNNEPYYGVYGGKSPQTWDNPDFNTRIRRLSQEHGIIKGSKDFYQSVTIGEILLFYPVHSCLTADCMKQYLEKGGKKIMLMK